MCKTFKSVKFFLYSDVKRSERGVVQNVGLSLAGEQKLDICDQSMGVYALRCAALATLDLGL